MTHCGTAQRWMTASLEGTLPKQEARALQAHLEGCPYCREMWAALQEVDRLFAAPPMAPVPEGFAARTLVRLQARQVAVARAGRRSLPWAWAAAAAAFLTVAAWWAALLGAGVPVLASPSAPLVWHAVRTLWEAVAVLARAAGHLLDALQPLCWDAALAAGTLTLFLLLLLMGGTLRRARLRA
ncbi:MAG: zf-HC2 domain-containing protein [Anaerolineae bacterium]|nr:zf-HC2 domain-containing protein [Anaerolineae bacterium]